MSILASIIIPVYNCEKYLPICLNSILAAQRTDLEIWLINDGSTDLTEQVCLEYAQKYSFIQTLTQKNAGPSVARNTGLAHASGEYVIFFDGDDFIDPEIFNQTLCQLTHSKADVWISVLQSIGPDGRLLPDIFPVGELKNPSADHLCMKKLWCNQYCFWSACAYIFRKTYIDQYAIRFKEGCHCGEDLEFVVHCLTHTQCILFYDHSYYFYRVNYRQTLTSNYTHQRAKDMLEMIQVSIQYLETSSSLFQQAVINRLAHEYIRLFYNFPFPQRYAARKVFWQFRNVLQKSHRPLEHFFALYLGIFRFSFTSLTLEGVKKSKSWLRSLRSILKKPES